jgi:hypothetical protein
VKAAIYNHQKVCAKNRRQRCGGLSVVIAPCRSFREVLLRRMWLRVVLSLEEVKERWSPLMGGGSIKSGSRPTTKGTGL